MNIHLSKNELLKQIIENVKKKHPWRISEDRYIEFFGELPREYLEERIFYDNLLSKTKQFKICNLVLSQVKIEICLNFDQLIAWELMLATRFDYKDYDITINDIKKQIKKE